MRSKRISFIAVLCAVCLALSALPSALADEGYFCGYNEHIHDESCYGYADIGEGEEQIEPDGHTEPVLICTMEEHVHTEACRSNSYFDTDSEEWEKRLPKKLTGNRSLDLVLAAKSQLGFEESEYNFIIDDYGNKKGYVIYGKENFDMPYGDWCAMFIGWCLTHAGIASQWTADTESEPYFPQNTNCQLWIEQLQAFGYYRSAGMYRPRAGDIMFLCMGTDGFNSDHVGVVTKLTPKQSGSVEVTVIEGNRDNTVKYMSYDIYDPQIRGYGVIPVDPDAYRSAEEIIQSYKNVG